MANDQIAHTYAQAIYEQAVERWEKQLSAVREALERQPDLITQIDSTAEAFSQKKAVVDRVLANADPEVRNFVYLLASKNDMHRLPEVLGEFEHLAAHGPSKELAKVTSAVELSQSEKSQLEAKLRAQFGHDLDVEYRLDPSILGGLIVRVGDRVIDGSVTAKLTAMRQKLETTR